MIVTGRKNGTSGCCLKLLGNLAGDKLEMQVLILPCRKRSQSPEWFSKNIYTRTHVLLEIMNLQTGCLHHVGKECRCCWLCLHAGVCLRLEFWSVIHGLVVNEYQRWYMKALPWIECFSHNQPLQRCRFESTLKISALITFVILFMGMKTWL